MRPGVGGGRAAWPNSSLAAARSAFAAARAASVTSAFAWTTRSRVPRPISSASSADALAGASRRWLRSAVASSASTRPRTAEGGADGSERAALIRSGSGSSPLRSRIAARVSSSAAVRSGPGDSSSAAVATAIPASSSPAFRQASAAISMTVARSAPIRSGRSGNRSHSRRTRSSMRWRSAYAYARRADSAACQAASAARASSPAAFQCTAISTGARSAGTSRRSALIASAQRRWSRTRSPGSSPS
ncbi:hypothetical protein ACFQY7_07690 [Actinomadura luteofluorescens]|uniref:hypothetical protein n=1 Tax=Actinomadura luteofluorescens TaxID=46163 RepID=UPI0036334AA5